MDGFPVNLPVFFLPQGQKEAVHSKSSLWGLLLGKLQAPGGLGFGFVQDSAHLRLPAVQLTRVAGDSRCEESRLHFTSLGDSVPKAKGSKRSAAAHLHKALQKTRCGWALLPGGRR